MSSRAIWIYAGLLTAALAVALAASRRTIAPASATPSVHNSGPAGIRALYLYLQEAGYDVAEEQGSLQTIAGKVRTVVIPAPTVRPLEGTELTAVRSFVERGGAIVYLASQPFGRAQAELDSWLQLEKGEWLQRENLGSPRGSAAVELWLPRSDRARRLSVAGDRGAMLGSADGLPIAASPHAIYAWWRAAGDGEIWIFAGPDFAQNDRIEEADNIEIWDALAARGPMLFDESHHHHRLSASATGAAARSLWMIAGQFLACALLYGYARGARLGPARPEVIERQRSSREYLESIAWLTRRARVERELLPELISRLRIAMQERLRIPVSLAEVDAALELESRYHLRGARLVELSEMVRKALGGPVVTSEQYARLARECAQLERLIAGHRGT